jgi:hypothetical protein
MLKLCSKRDNNTQEKCRKKTGLNSQDRHNITTWAETHINGEYISITYKAMINFLSS